MPHGSDDALSALEDSLSRGVTAAECGFFFDFDGTLAPIQLDPDTVEPVPGVADRLAALVETGASVALVSARPVEFLASRFPHIQRMKYFGLYGLEWATGDAPAETHPVAGTFVETMAAVARAARAELPAAISVEHKRLTVALHYRAAPGLADEVDRWAGEICAEAGVISQRGRMVVELKPPNAPTKGTVVGELARDLAFACYVGDDVGDIAAFESLRARESDGTGFTTLLVAIHNPESGQELEPMSRLVLGSATEMPGFLDRLLGCVGGGLLR